MASTSETVLVLRSYSWLMPAASRAALHAASRATSTPLLAAAKVRAAWFEASPMLEKT